MYISNANNVMLIRNENYDIAGPFDTINNNDSNVTINGSEGDDLIYNYDSYVMINGKAGDDNLVSFDDYGSEYVTISGGSGQNTISCWSSYASIVGGKGSELIHYYGSSRSTIFANEGNDSIYGNGSYAFINCGEGNDNVNAASYATVMGDSGNDTIIGQYGGHALIHGGDGDDSIKNISDYSTLMADSGDDTICNVSSYALIYGGEGRDSILHWHYDGYSTIIGGKGDDTVYFKSSNGSTCAIQYSEGDGNDIVIFDMIPDNINLSTPQGNYTVYQDGNDWILKIGNGSIRLQYINSIHGIEFPLPLINGVSVETINSTSPTTQITTTTTISTPVTTTATTTQSAASGNGSGDTIINNYYGDYNDFSDNNGTIVINSSVEGGVGNTVIINKEGDTYTYNGGDRVINNYQQGEVVRLDDYQGLDDISGNSFYIKSKSGRLEIQNSRDKFIGYSAGNSDVIAYSYVASGGGNVDGRGKSQAEILIGADHQNNQIFAGNGGSSVWGGNGGADTLVGGDGYDEFVFAQGSGGDVIQNAGSNDLVNLLGITLDQIADVSVSLDQVHINFTNGEFLQVKGNSGVGYRLQNQTYVCNQSTGQWSTK